MKKEIRTVLSSSFFATAVFTYIFLVLCFPEISAKGVTEGLKLSVDVLIPTLFPFMVGSGFLVNSGYIMRENKVSTFLSEKLFRLGNTAFPVLILSLLGGYPVGAKTVSELYKKGYINQSEFKRMVLFAVNPSPSFVISTVGFGMYRNLKSGVIMYASIVISTFLMAIVGRVFRDKKEDRSYCCLPEADLNLSKAFTESIKDSTFSILYICAYVVLFSSVARLVENLNISQNISVFLSSVLEVSFGVQVVFRNFSASHVCALLSFGGMSTVFQIMNIIAESGVRFTEFIFSRVVAALLSGICYSVLLKFFPISTETFSNANIEIITSPSDSFSVSICLVLMAVLFIMGDSIIDKKSLTEKVIQSKMNKE